ncbi:hypothetical protein ACFCVO_01725 [Agromyces sp. NPDC056379]|uniref:hypothetical protein n=1 Tax=unclassified Agromyces TaxID=2639701 RepID=UPI0035DD8712
MGTPIIQIEVENAAPVGVTMQAADAFDRATTPVTVTPGGTGFVWSSIVDRRNSGEECVAPIAIAGLVIQLPGASNQTVAAVDLEQCELRIG